MYPTNGVLVRHLGLHVLRAYPQPFGRQRKSHHIRITIIAASRSAPRVLPTMTMVTRSAPPPPQTDLKTVVESRNREWHFHIYFLIQSQAETAAALALRDAVLRLRRDGMSQDPSHPPHGRRGSIFGAGRASLADTFWFQVPLLPCRCSESTTTQ